MTRVSLTFLSNINYKKSFFCLANVSNIIFTLGLTNNNKSCNMFWFWFIGIIKSVWLVFDLY